MGARPLFALLAALAATAQAQKVTVAVLPFDGPQGGRAQAAVVQALQGSVELTPQARSDAAASRVAQQGLDGVREELGAQVVVAGGVRKDKGWALVIEVRS